MIQNTVAGDSDYELACKNNTPFLYLNSTKYRLQPSNYQIYTIPSKYHIQSINYRNYTIRLAEPSVKQNDTCSSLNNPQDLFPDQYVYDTSFWSATWHRHAIASPLNFLSCLYPVNDSRYIATDGCFNRDYDLNASDKGRHTYVVVGHMEVTDLWVNCRVDFETMTSLPFKDKNIISVSEIQTSLVYGFELSWIDVYCRNMCDQSICWYDGNGIACNKFLPCYSYEQYGEDEHDID